MRLQQEKYTTTMRKNCREKQINSDTFRYWKRGDNNKVTNIWRKV